MDKKDWSIDSYIIIWNTSIVLTKLSFGCIIYFKHCNINFLNVLLYPETLGNGCFSFKFQSLLSCFPSIYIMGFDI